VACLLAAFGSTAAGAYLLPSGAILRRLGNARDESPAASLRVDGSGAFFGEAAAQASSALRASLDRPEFQADATLWLKAPARCRLEVFTPDGARTAVAQNAGKRRVEGGATAAMQTALEHLCALLATRSGAEGGSRAAVERHLAALKVSPRAVSLGRMGREVAYVLGDPAPGQPQFWVYKDSFLPARLTFTDAQNVAWDLRLSDYGSPVTGTAAPRVFELHRAGALALRFTSLRADVRPTAAPDRLF